ncbi:MAG: DUF4982 domain-containing protein [Oscillospiraceae bacterium]|jgi:beta-galactosidase|nr:DUF4982 domain-containing protein [Oscillospiraceae bacterium]
MYLQNNLPRNTEFFGFNWHFRLADQYNDEPGIGLTGYRPVQLPHDWSVEYPFDENAETFGSGGYVKAGIGWYKKTFRVAPSCKGKNISLLFDGAYMNTKVTLNGKLLGEHVYGYTPFEFDITDKLDYDGENELAVRIDNSFQPNSRWYSGSGITREVWLKSVNTTHIPTYGTFITTEQTDKNNAQVNIATKIEITHMADESASVDTNRSTNRDTSKSIKKLVTTIYDDQNRECASNAIEIKNTGEYMQAITIQNPKLWTAQTPNLYKAISKITNEDEIIDEYETVFGIRSVEFSPEHGCLINGAQVKLSGVCVHHDGGSVGAAVPKKVWERRLKTLKKMGCNAIRCAHNPPDPGLLELCDELGFYVMDEAFDEWALLKWKTQGSNTHESRGYSEYFNDNHVADLEAMLYRDRNHPSVIIWSIGNEVPEQSTPDGYILAKKLQDICHYIDPTRLCTQANDQIFSEPNPATKEFLDTMDIVSYNYTPRWRSRAETLYYDDKRANPNWLILGVENLSAAGTRGDYRMELPENYWRRPYFSAVVNVQKLLRYTMTHDYVIGDFMWTGIDYLGEAHWPARSSNAGVLDTCGFPKDHYYFYQSIWVRDEPMVYVYPHRNLNVLEGQMIPVLCYTNCEYAELFVNGKSYGKKAYSYPAYGMTETYGHWDKPLIAANTDDMFLSWDVPVTRDSIEVVGYIDNKEACRHKVEAAGEPAVIIATCDSDVLKADGRDIAHIEISIEDSDGVFNPIAENTICVDIDGEAELIGLDNGMPDCHESFKGAKMNAGGGLLLAIIRSKRNPGDITVTITSDKLKPAVVNIKSK